MEIGDNAYFAGIGKPGNEDYHLLTLSLVLVGAGDTDLRL